MEIQDAKQARPHCELIAELLDSRQPKTEREHAAVREIERLRAESAENERLRARILELENELAAGVHTCGPTCRKTPVCAELADLREAIRSCLVYWLGGESPDDCPHTVAKIKALCDWDSQLPAARSAP